MFTLQGGCHCGGLRVELTTQQSPAILQARACDCSFCRKHGAAYVSDPAGGMRVIETTKAALQEYRHSSRTAQFLICAACGVLIAVCFTASDGVYGAVNACCLEEEPRLGPALAASPQRLTPQERVERWRMLWVPNVEVKSFAA